MTELKVLSIAVAKGRTGYVFLSNSELRDWGISVKASKNSSHLVGWLQDLINYLQPDVVVTEKTSGACRKGRRTKEMIRTLAEITAHNYVLDVSVERQRHFASKYEEAAVLAGRYPELRGWVPKKRRYFESEPRNTIIFEALVLAEGAISNSASGSPGIEK